MPIRELQVVAEGFSFLEGPRWRDGRVWLSDFYTHQVVAVDANGSREVMAVVPAQPSGLGWLPDGRLLVVSMKDRRILRRESSGKLVEHADLSSIGSGDLNDMVVDDHGRAYVGEFGFDLFGGETFRPGCIFRVDPDGTVALAADGLCQPNGSAIADDGRTLIVGETFGNRISAFEIGADGTLGSRRDWAHFGDLPDTDSSIELARASAVMPDGCTLDAEGALWVADVWRHRVVRVAEGGAILEEIDTGGVHAYACMLGGEDGRTLFLCTAPAARDTERLQQKAGQLWSTVVDVPHAGLP